MHVLPLKKMLIYELRELKHVYLVPYLYKLKTVPLICPLLQ